MGIRFWNSLTRAAEYFVPQCGVGGEVKMYTCGPTVYAHAHIGNFRAYVFEDLLQRHLEYRGYRVHRVMNLTDVDDKTIRGANSAGVPLQVFTLPFKEAFFKDLAELRIKPATDFPAATDPDNIARMIDMIGTLIFSGHAYLADDRSVYFRISSFPAYGRLAHIDPNDLRPTGRIQNDEYEKESIGDFALWKAWTPADGEVGWESPWGRGRPGWHIECSAMANRLLGDSIDIHCGGVDNIFPHHEAEIAQTECCTGKVFARYWLHCAHLQVEGQKMSKSAGNFFTIRDLLQRGWSGRELRYSLLCVDYRLPLNFRLDGLEAAHSALKRIDEWVERIARLAGDTLDPKPGPVDPADAFGQALDGDLNISSALAVLFQTIRDTNRLMDQGALTGQNAKHLLDWWISVNRVLAIEADSEQPPPDVIALVERRQTVRAARDWKESDALRDQIQALGWEVKDTKAGQDLSRKR